MSSAALTGEPKPILLNKTEVDELRVTAGYYGITRPETIRLMVRFALENQEYFSSWMRQQP